jgi:transposase InsO family protein
MVKMVLSIFKPRQELVLENLALRQQIMVLKRSAKRPRLTKSDRLFWIVLSKFWSRWSEVLQLVKPETVVRWHRESFRHYWTWKSRVRRFGRPSIDPKVRVLIRDMCRANPLWGAPRIHGELLKLDIRVSQATVSKYMVRRHKPPSQSWRAFLDNHVQDLVSIDFLTVPTATFRVLFVFIVFSHDRRRVIHFNVTEHPTAQWTAQQILEAFPFDMAPKYLLRDRDGIYGFDFQHRVASMGIEEVLTAPRSPWQNAYVERIIGSIRRECLDHVIILNEAHVRRILRSYFSYYHDCRTHLSLDKDSPEPRELEPSSMGEVIALPQVGGLHHRYTRQAA